jgi:hypothetical protein
VELGFISEDGATFTEEKEVVAKSSWTSLYPKKFMIVGRRAVIKFALREFNKRAVEFALEGPVTKVAAEWKYVPPAMDAAFPKALVVEWEDGANLFRLYFPTGIVSAPTESQMSRTNPTDLPVTYSSYKSGTGNPYTLFMDD